MVLPFCVFKWQAADLVPTLIGHLFRLFPVPLTAHTMQLGEQAWAKLSRGDDAVTKLLVPELVMLRAAMKGGLVQPQLGSPSKHSPQKSRPSASAAANEMAKLALKKQCLGVLGTLAKSTATSSYSPQNLFYFSSCLSLVTSALSMAPSTETGPRKPHLDGDARIPNTAFHAATQCFRCIASAAAHEVSTTSCSFLGVYFDDILTLNTSTLMCLIIRLQQALNGGAII